MASVNFEKLKSASEVKAMLRHCDIDERMKTEAHSNRHIDKSLTGNNQQYEMNYMETCNMYDERIAYLDTLEGQNKRSDRVTCFGLEIPFPEKLQAHQEQKWIENISDILIERYGENVLNLYVHRDEKHTYTDAETGKTRESRNHIHAYVIPEINGKLNGKAFSSKKAMVSLNNEIQTMTQDNFGIDFMDGTKKKSKDSVESLKQKSEKKALEQAKNDYEKALRTIRNRERDLDVRESDLQAQEDKLQEKAKEIALQEEKALKMQNMALQMQEKLQEKLQDADEMLAFASQSCDWYNDIQRQHQLTIKKRRQQGQKMLNRMPQRSDEGRYFGE